MKVLVIGSGGREHALVWKIRQSKKVTEVFCAPGNAGIAQDAICVGISAENVQGLLSFAQEKSIDLTVVGPEGPLAAGLTDAFEAAGLKVFGPSRQAALIEASKADAKAFMKAFNIPTAKYEVFDDAKQAKSYINDNPGPCVVKADGLAAGKGVYVCDGIKDAAEALNTIMVDKAYGEAGKRVIVEERLVGEEVSVLAFTDGVTVVPMVSSQDHKQVYDGDRGPNTGGMGAYAPAPVYTPLLEEQVKREIILPTINGLSQQGRPYRGVVYFGLMVTAQGPKVLEYNARFGDPETQPVLMLLKSDLVEIMEAIIDKRLTADMVQWHEGAAACVVLASQGYPGKYEKGRKIEGLTALPEGVVVFHAGTCYQDGNYVTSGGRVLGVCATGKDIKQALANAYSGVKKIGFEGMHYRNDIGYRALQRLS